MGLATSISPADPSYSETTLTTTTCYALGGREVLFFLGTESKLLFALLGEQVFCLHQSHTSKVV